ncbi:MULTISPECIES: LysM peptidoglycan-binding domain-containing protein [unclassified Devosia]|uniref:LysM peptidoglycan-binding domain-containing protein n=1 Tax=unclassified Devosia TaxID=196773 RepID=UPI001AED15BF|nr:MULTISPECIES: LysM peptidoglycan-binding domain-containing protein [unclassified Devosia]
MGHCLRGKMSDAGILPAPAVAATDVSAPASATEAVALAPAQSTPATETLAEPNASRQTPPAPADSVVAANFGLLRAEPDGSVVIAGSGKPGSEVEVFSDGASIGRTNVEASGDWVLVPESPLPPGGTELTLAEVGEKGQSGQSFVVVIDEARTAEPLVVASTPGQASEVLQGLERPIAGAETTTQSVTEPTATTPETPAAATSPSPSAAVSRAEAPAAPADAQPEAQAATAATPGTLPIGASTTAPPVEIAAAPQQEPTAQLPAQPKSVVAPAQNSGRLAGAPPLPSGSTVPGSPGATVPTAVPFAGQAPANPQVAAVPESAAPSGAAAPETLVAATPSVPSVQPGEEPSSLSAPTQPTIDAIEVEGERAFFAGAGPEGGTVRLYVDDVFIADAIVSDGRWLVEGGNVLTNPNQRIRVDLIDPADASVSARAEVNFVLEVPTADAPTAVAQAPRPTSARPAAAPTPSAGATEQQAPVNTQQPGPVAEAGSSAPQATSPPASERSPTTASSSAVAVNPQPKAAEAPAAAGSVASARSAAESGPADAAVRPDTTLATKPTADQVSPPDLAEPSAAYPAVETPASAPAVAASPRPSTVAPGPAAPDEVPTMVGVQVGNAEEQRFASGKAIIRRGDNLWTIARRVYGAGIKYTTIYQANNGQIRDPNRIYPGQVFDLPAREQ